MHAEGQTLEKFHDQKISVFVRSYNMLNMIKT